MYNINHIETLEAIVRRVIWPPLLALALLITLCGGRCDESSEESSSSATQGAAVAISYDTFLAALAENGWIPTPEQKAAGNVTKGVEVTVRSCGIELKLDTPTAIDYHVTSVNGQEPAFFGRESETLLGEQNVTRKDFEQHLKYLQETLHAIDAC